MHEVTVHTKTACVQCDAVFRSLDRLGLGYRHIDLTEDPQAREFVLALGYLQAPVVYAGPQQHFSRFRPELLRRLAA